MIYLIKNAIECAERLESKLTPETAAILSMTGIKVRHFLNNVCAPPETVFLEIGAWNGGTSAAAACGNPGIFHTVDKFCDFGGSADGTRAKFAEVGVNVTLWEWDCWEIPLDLLPHAVNVFFYDGPHDYDSHRRAVPHFAPILADEFILIMDDFEDEKVRRATQEGIEEMKMRVLDYCWLGCGEHESRAGWWNSTGVFVLRKPDDEI